MLHTIKTARGNVNYSDIRFYVVIIAGKTHIVKCKPAQDGGMVEFTDAITGELAGSCGIHWFPLNVVDLADFVRPIPVRPPWPAIEASHLDTA